MGSDSDWPIMKPAVELLKEFGVEVDVIVASAHRTPAKVHEYAENARENGVGVIIAAAGAAAHLAGVIASYTTLPVIGVPINATPLNGLDALLSTVQMPSGIPVATMAGKSIAGLATQYVADAREPAASGPSAPPRRAAQPTPMMSAIDRTDQTIDTIGKEIRQRQEATASSTLVRAEAIAMCMSRYW